MYRLCLCVWTLLAAIPAFAQSLPSITPADRLQPLQTLADRLPWQAVGRLDTGSSFCTATLIDAETVLTAAHCLFDRNSGARFPDSALTFRAGLTDGQIAAQRGIAISSIPATYRLAEGDPARLLDDIALLRLDRPVRAAEIRPLPVGAAPRIGEPVTLVSYGRDREEIASIEEDCAVEDRQQGIVILSCQVDPGTSGAPVLAVRGGMVSVVSVVSASATRGTDPVGLAVDLTNRIVALRTGLTTSPRPATGGLPQVRTLVDGADGRDTVGARFVRP